MSEPADFRLVDSGRRWPGLNLSQAIGRVGWQCINSSFARE